MAGYGTDQGLADWLTANGQALPVGAPSPAVLRQRGSAYIDAVYGARFQGVPTDGLDQDRAWPRTGATAYGAEIVGNAVPQRVIQASYAAALQEAAEPGSLSVIVTAAAMVKREKVGSIEVEYRDSGDSTVAASTPTLLAVEGLLAPLLYQPEAAIFVV